MLADNKNRKTTELKAKKLPKAIHKSESDRIKAEYDASVRKLLGDQKYAQWDKNRNMAADRKLKQRYGMTPAQIAQYKNLQNACVVEMYKISHSKLPETERESKNREINTKYEAGLQEVLSAEQYRKMAADKAYSEQKKITTNNK